MSKNERTLPATGNHWGVRIFSALGAGAGMACALWLLPFLGIQGMGGIPVIAAIVVGILAGNLVGRLLFPPTSRPS